jgi:vitamin B12 transport system substrate-binding protein
VHFTYCTSLFAINKKRHMRFITYCFLVICSCSLFAAPQKIISLAPHITELVFALGAGDRLVASSDYSTYPEQAKSLPSVANYNGVDFEQIMRLQPDLIIAWQGGNKPQDLARLSAMGFHMYYSSPQRPADIADEIDALGKILNTESLASQISADFRKELANIESQFTGKQNIRVFYYMWPKPLMTIGAWANQLLNICGARNVFDDAPSAYPEVGIEEVIHRRPQKIVVAMHVSHSDAEIYWQDWRYLLDAPLIVVDPDELHRFTPRLLNGLNALCQALHQ